MPLSYQHQCLLYEGSPVQHLPNVCATICRKLRENYRCLYLNSSPMVAGMRSYLAASGVDVTQSVDSGRLVLSSEQHHLVDGHFDIDHMMSMLREALRQALADGYAGLWATGDMTWEFGPDRDFSRLVEYEQKLEEYMRNNPELGGICMYHADTLPRECLLEGLVTHPAIFVNDTLSRVNPKYLPPDRFAPELLSFPEFDYALAQILQAEGAD